MKNNLQTPVQYLKGVGPRISKLLEKLGIRTIEDLLYFFPCEYEDRRTVSTIASLKEPNEKVIINGQIVKVEQKRTRSRFSILNITLDDQTGKIKTVFFNQPYLLKLFRAGQKLVVSGKAEINLYEGGLQILPRDWEIDDGNLLKIVPIYHLTEGLYAKYLRKIIKNAVSSHLQLVLDPIPLNVAEKNGLLDLKESIETLHFPKDLSLIGKARNRIIFEDFFVFQAGLGLRKKTTEMSKGIKFTIQEKYLEEFSLPFSLTQAQIRVLSEIFQDMSGSRPMNRLLQGDVGSGKTIIAAIAAFTALKNGYQTAVMAPTEILAQQHYQKFSDWLSPRDIALVTGTTQKKSKKIILDQDIIIGTHALIEEKIKFKKLGLVIVDEQHRFGVLQRSVLSQKGVNPDILFMTATPIPRSLALTVYGDLDRSIIDEMPPGRKPIKTHFVPNSKRKQAYEFIREKINEGQQVFVVCPLVSESESLDLKAAVIEAQNLQDETYKEFKVGLIHGRLKSPDKDRIMDDFRRKKIHILVSTTVIEVGIDVPNASIMVIEHAERFGLSQLHQLRGRIGRGTDESFCFLMGDPKSIDARARIKAMLDHNDGFKIAEVDLQIRGPGDFFGVKQSGLPEFRLADIIRDEKTLQIARDEAFKYLEIDPDLLKHPLLKESIKIRFGRFLGY